MSELPESSARGIGEEIGANVDALVQKLASSLREQPKRHCSRTFVLWCEFIVFVFRINQQVAQSLLTSYDIRPPHPKMIRRCDSMGDLVPQHRRLGRRRTHQNA